MTRSLTPDTANNAPAGNRLGDIRLHMANSLIGRTVQLLASTTQITPGVVTAVFSEAGRPKLFVGGTGYDLNQILTVVPTSVN